MRNRIDAYERSTELQTTVTPINILDAINFCVEAWQSVKGDTIRNCWHKTGILPDSREVEMPLAEIESDTESVQRLIDNLGFEEPITAEEYINVDDNVMTGGLTDEEIVAVVCPPEEESDEGITRPAVSVKEALGGVSSAIEFLVNPPDDFAFDIKMISELHKVQGQLWGYHLSKKKQSTMDSFI